MLNRIREKFHPVFWLMKFNFFRSIFKFKLIYLKKSKIFGNFFLYFPRNLNFIINLINYEKETFDFIKKINHQKNLTNTSFIDIGGNIGLYSFFFKKFYNTKIFIFEPDIENLLLLLKTKQKNNYDNFIILPFAISNKRVISKFLVDDVSGLTGTLSEERNVPQVRMKLNKKIDVFCEKLDTYKNLINKVSWIKIDIEGHELEALEGMMELIKESQPNLIIESNEKNIPEISKKLDLYEYKIKKLKSDPNYIFYK